MCAEDKPHRTGSDAGQHRVSLLKDARIQNRSLRMLFSRSRRDVGCFFHQYFLRNVKFPKRNVSDILKGNRKPVNLLSARVFLDSTDVPTTR